MTHAIQSGVVKLRRRPRQADGAAAQTFGVRHPARAVVLGFALAVGIGTVLLAIPAATPESGSATFLEALFTATSAVCVTGLTLVDTGAHWSGFGQGVILALIQLGGLGIMTAASVMGLVVFRRLGLRTRLTTAAETRSVGLGEVRSLLGAIARTTLLVEVVVAVLIAARLSWAYGIPTAESIWLGSFHSVSAFNNAGFALYRDSLVGFASDPWLMLPIALSVVLGGLGFPVVLELWRERRQHRGWSLHTRMTVWMTALLVTMGTLFVTAMEWANPATLGPMGAGQKILNGFVQAVMPRTAGFNSVDIGAMNPETWFGIDVMMFIGGGSGGTAGGIKVTTFAVLLFLIVAEVRGDTEGTAFRRRIPVATHRQALTVALAAVAVVVISAMVLLILSPFTLDQVLFEVVSAFATVGLSTGITAQLPTGGQFLLVALMFIGRLGPVTFASALALRERQILYAYPEEQPIIG